MSVKKGLLTVSEFAEVVGVSRQRIYKMLKETDNQLHNYVNVVNGKKYIEITACRKLFGVTEFIETDNEAVNLSTQTDNDTVNQNNNADNPDYNAVIEILREQLQVKDQQLAELHKLLSQQQQITFDLQRKLELLSEPEPEIRSDKQKGNNKAEARVKQEESQEEVERKPHKWWRFWEN